MLSVVGTVTVLAMHTSKKQWGVYHELGKTCVER